MPKIPQYADKYAAESLLREIRTRHGKDDSADSRRKESQQKHRMQKLAKGRSKIAPVHPLSGNGANLMDAILKGKK